MVDLKEAHSVSVRKKIKNPPARSQIKIALRKLEGRIELYKQFIPWPGLIQSLEEDARQLRSILDRQ